MSSQKVKLRKIKHVQVVPHDPSWAESYHREASKLSAILGEQVIAAFHAGSTSIPGIKAKPVVDILLVVSDIHKVDDYDTRLAELGYEAIGEMGIPGRRFFTRTEGDVRTHNIHIFQFDHPEVEQMLNFRDYLRSHPEEAEQYSHLKEELSVLYSEDIDSYIAGKSSFIRKTIQDAAKWRQENGQGSSWTENK